MPLASCGDREPFSPLNLFPSVCVRVCMYARIFLCFCRYIPHKCGDYVLAGTVVLGNMCCPRARVTMPL